MTAPSSKRRVTLKDIARETGYHFTTVSLALREHSSIPEETRKKILEAAEKMGYARDPVFSVLSHFHTKGRVQAETPRIAFLLNYGVDNEGRLYPHMQAIWEGVQRQARLLGYQLEQVFVSEDEFDSAHLEGHLKAKGVSGVIIGAFQPGFTDLAINWDNYAVVKINSGHMEPRSPAVSNDQMRDVRLAFQRMYALGYRRIGLAIGRADEDAAGRRHTAGYVLEQAARPAEERVPPLLFPYVYDTPSISGLVGRWVRRYQIDAVLCNWGNIDRLLMFAGIRVPEDVACACLCIAKPYEHLAGIYPDMHVVGERAVTLIATLLKTGQYGVPEFASITYVQSPWKDGATAPARHG